MDELDLVRLSCPSTIESDDEGIAAIKARALGPVVAAVDAPADGAAVIELSGSPLPRRRPRTQLVAMVAAVVLLVVGGVALSRRRTSDEGARPISGADRSVDDAGLAQQLAGAWSFEELVVGGNSALFASDLMPASTNDAPGDVSFDSATGSAAVMMTAWCPTIATWQYRVEKGRLILPDGLADPGDDCANPALRPVVEHIVALLNGAPTIGVAGDFLSLTRTKDDRATLHRVPGAGGDVPAAAVSAVPTLAQLDGQTFGIEALTVGSEDQTLVTTSGRPLTVKVSGSIVIVDTGCNDGGGAARIENGHLVIDEWGTSLVACGGPVRVQEDAMRALFTARPAISLHDDELTLTSASSSLRAHRRNPDSPPTSVSATTIGPVQPATSPPLPTIPIDAGAPPIVPTMAELEGHRFDIVRLVVDGSDRPIVNGITGRVPSVGVIGDILNVDGGCNGTGATARVEDGRLHVRPDEYGLRTSTACSPEGSAQEDALDAIVLATPLVSLHGSVLTFTADRSLIEARVRPDKPLVGTRWRTNGRLLPDNRGLGYGGADGTLMLKADGTWTYSGCTYEQGRYALEGTTLVLTRDPMTSATVVSPSCTAPVVEDEQLTMRPIFDQPLTWSVASEIALRHAVRVSGATSRNVDGVLEVRGDVSWERDDEMTT